VAKLVLVVTALGIELLLEEWLSLSAAAEIVALWLASRRRGRPLLHERLMAGWRRPSRVAPASPAAHTQPRGDRRDDAVTDTQSAPRETQHLLIMSDQHRADIMGCAGDPLVRTPRMDRLAAEGIRFASAYCQAPVQPARASLLHRTLRPRPRSPPKRHDTPTELATSSNGGRAGYHTSCTARCTCGPWPLVEPTVGARTT